MRRERSIITIDEELCNGCGVCVPGCAEGALAIVNGKARLVGEVYCDGLGACVGTCPTGALKVIEEEAEEFDEEKVRELLKKKESIGRKPPEAQLSGCPSARAMTIAREKGGHCDDGLEITSELTHWPVKLQLLNPHSSFLEGADLLLLADCAAVSFPDLHRKLLKDHVVAILCPKFDKLEEHIEKLGEILETARPRSITIAHMEVPCCHGLHYAALKAYEEHNGGIPITRMVLSRDGRITREEKVRECAVESGS
jgi:NAD-dependent dihydropyrimidine dehydrogenase PreA subunit